MPEPVWQEMVDHCRSAGVNETGGILLGSYRETQDLAVLTQAAPPPRDSRTSRASFERGTRGVRSWLRRLWRRREYYLGEWHFHPKGAAQPSGQDRHQMCEIARDDAYQCPVPILVIVADPGGSWRVGVWAYERGNEVPLFAR